MGYSGGPEGAPTGMANPLFLSLVTVVRDRADELRDFVERLARVAGAIASDYEIIIVDNASDDGSVEVLKELTSSEGIHNLQVYALAIPVDLDTAQFAGVENAIGDFVAIVDLDLDDPEFLPTMVEAAMTGKDVVLADNTRRPRTSLVYRLASASFHRLYHVVHGVHLGREAPRYRVLSRKVVNYVLQHDSPNLVYRRVPATAGFAKARLTYASSFEPTIRRGALESLESSVRMLVSSGSEPLRLMSGLCLFGATANIVYSVYVLGVLLFKQDVAPGWATLSLQQSGMFFLISLVLLLLGEYVLHITQTTQKRPMYSVGQEMTSRIVTRRERINVEERT